MILMMILTCTIMCVTLLTLSKGMEKELLAAEEDTRRDEKVSSQASDEDYMEGKDETLIDNVAGPTYFYSSERYRDRDNIENPKFLMKIHEPLVANITHVIGNKTEEWDTFVLDQPAQGGIFVGWTDRRKDECQVVIDYKRQVFTGKKSGNKLENPIITMVFKKGGGTWRLTELSILDVSMKSLDVNLEVTTKDGYTMSAPIGFAFSCNHQVNLNSINQPGATFGATLQFSQMQLQVFEVNKGVFGPEWECVKPVSFTQFQHNLLLGLIYASQYHPDLQSLVTKLADNGPVKQNDKKVHLLYSK